LSVFGYSTTRDVNTTLAQTAYNFGIRQDTCIGFRVDHASDLLLHHIGRNGRIAVKGLDRRRKKEFQGKDPLRAAKRLVG